MYSIDGDGDGDGGCGCGGSGVGKEKGSVLGERENKVLTTNLNLLIRFCDSHSLHSVILSLIQMAFKLLSAFLSLSTHSFR